MKRFPDTPPPKRSPSACLMQYDWALAPTFLTPSETSPSRALSTLVDIVSSPVYDEHYMPRALRVCTSSCHLQSRCRSPLYGFWVCAMTVRWWESSRSCFRDMSPSSRARVLVARARHLNRPVLAPDGVVVVVVVDYGGL